MRKFSILFLTLVSACSICRGQLDNMNCAKNYSLYKEFMKVGSYDLAVEPFWQVANECPKFRKSMYDDGLRLYFNIGPAGNARWQGIHDTIMMLFDRKMANFGDSAKLLQEKTMAALDLCRDKHDYLEVYKMGLEALEASRNRPSAKFLHNYLKLASLIFSEQMITPGQLYRDLLPAYCNILDFAAWEEFPDTRKDVRSIMDFLAKHRGEYMFDSFLESETRLPSSIAALRGLMRFMAMSGNTGNSLAKRSADSLHARSNSYETAFGIAEAALECGFHDLSAEYFEKASQLADCDSASFGCASGLALCAYQQRNIKQAYTLARSAISKYPQMCSGMYLLIAMIYSEESRLVARIFSLDSFRQSELFWIAADYAQRCISMGHPDAEKARKWLMERCKPYFPGKDEAFMHSVMPGDKVALQLFDSETTIARF